MCHCRRGYLVLQWREGGDVRPFLREKLSSPWFDKDTFTLSGRSDQFIPCCEDGSLCAESISEVEMWRKIDHHKLQQGFIDRFID